jgi:hypothetical protein
MLRLQSVNFPAKGGDSLLVDLAQAFFVRLVVLAAQILHVVLVEGPEELMISTLLLWVCNVGKADLASCDRLYELVVDPNKHNKPIENC